MFDSPGPEADFPSVTWAQKLTSSVGIPLGNLHRQLSSPLVARQMNQL